MSSSKSPCAACKCLRRKCTQECVFAPYFPPDNPQKFTHVHEVFGASNVSKLLCGLPPSQREDAVNSLAYEAEYRLKDPVYGCVGLVSILQQRLKQIQHDLECAKRELATYIGPSAMLPILNPAGVSLHQQPSYGPPLYQMMPHHVQQMVGLPAEASHEAQLMIREPVQQMIRLPLEATQGAQLMIHESQEHQQQQHIVEAQQLAIVAAARDQEMLRAYERQQLQHQQQNNLLRFNDGLDDAGVSATATGFNQMPAAATATSIQPSLALGGCYETQSYHLIQQHEHQQENSHSQSQRQFHYPHQLQLRQIEHQEENSHSQSQQQSNHPHQPQLQQHEHYPPQQIVTAHHQQQHTLQQLAQPQGSQ